MIVIPQGATTGTALEVETATRAARVVQNPLDFGPLGSYSISNSTGTMAAGLAANSEIYQWRWMALDRVCLLRSVRISGGPQGITAFAAGVITFQIFIAQNWTGQGTGGTVINVAMTGRRDNRMNGSGAAFTVPTVAASGDVRISSTAALGVGTKTLDANAMASISSSTPAVAGRPFFPDVGVAHLFQRDTEGEYPYVFTAFEGFVIRATVPATGTWVGTVTVEWSEVPTY